MSLTHQIIESLEEQTNTLKVLNTLLEDELQSLKDSNFSQLEQFAEQKEKLSKQIEEGSRTRLILLKDFNKKTERDALSAFISQCSDEDRNQLEKVNQQLVDEIVRCRELNSVNGQIISTNLNQRRELFKQIQSNGSTDLYTKTGKLSSHQDKGLHDEA